MNKKINAINNKIEESKPQFDLDWQTAKIFALSSRNISKSEFLTGKDVFAWERLSRKSCYNQNNWIFALRQRIKSTHWHFKETVSSIR